MNSPLLRECLVQSYGVAAILMHYRSWIEGGVNNLPPYTSIYCAPKDVSCESDTWASVLLQNPNYPHTQSEQDWQGNAHSMLGVCGHTAPPTLIITC
jgi:hypothetical protein